MPYVTSTRSASRHHRRHENQGFAVSPAQPPPALAIRLPALFPEGTICAPIHRGDYARACAPIRRSEQTSRRDKRRIRSLSVMAIGIDIGTRWGNGMPPLAKGTRNSARCQLRRPACWFCHWSWPAPELCESPANGDGCWCGATGWLADTFAPAGADRLGGAPPPTAAPTPRGTSDRDR